MDKPVLQPVLDTVENMRNWRTYDGDIDLVRNLLMRAIWWCAWAESGLGRSPLDESDFLRAARIIMEEISPDNEAPPAEIDAPRLWTFS